MFLFRKTEEEVCKAEGQARKKINIDKGYLILGLHSMIVTLSFPK